MCFRYLFQFVLEGTVGGGSKGDIAVDDLMVLDGNCETILKQGRLTNDVRPILNSCKKKDWIVVIVILTVCSHSIATHQMNNQCRAPHAFA